MSRRQRSKLSVVETRCVYMMIPTCRAPNFGMLNRETNKTQPTHPAKHVVSFYVYIYFPSYFAGVWCCVYYIHVHVVHEALVYACVQAFLFSRHSPPLNSINTQTRILSFYPLVASLLSSTRRTLLRLVINRRASARSGLTNTAPDLPC